MCKQCPYQPAKGVRPCKPHSAHGNCARNHLTILPDGDVYACRRMSSRVGNVNTDDLNELWTTKMEAYRAVERFDKCSRCPLKYICRGCPAVAYGYTHDMYAADPQCWREVA